MDNQSNDKDCTSEDSSSNPEMTYGSEDRDCSERDEKPTSGPTVLLWIWNLFAFIPKTVTNLYFDIKNGELFAKFALLDAMCQFIVAVATSCHPQEDGTTSEDEKEENSPTSKRKETKPFAGAGRSLRSRTVETKS